jgi:hypothetical protein
MLAVFQPAVSHQWYSTLEHSGCEGHAGNDSLMEVARESDLTALLLDVCELALCRVSNPGLFEDRLPQQGSDLNQLQASLSALQAVLALKLSSPPLSLELCCDLMLLLIDVAQVSTRLCSLRHIHPMQMLCCIRACVSRHRLH